MMGRVLPDITFGPEAKSGLSGNTTFEKNKINK